MNEPKKHSNALLYGIIVGILLGITLGGLAPAMGREIAFIGEMFLNALKMLVVPLVMASLIVGISRLGDVRKLGGIAGRTVAYYLTTTCLAVVVGLALVLIIQPGKVDTEGERIAFRGGELLSSVQYAIEDDQLTLADATFSRDFAPHEGKGYMIELLDQTTEVKWGTKTEARPIRGTILQVDPERGVARVKTWRDAKGDPATPQATGTGVRVDIAVAGKVEGKSGSAKDALIEAIKGLVHPNLFDAMVETKILPLLLFSLVFGAVLTTLGKQGQVLIDVFRSLDLAIMTIVDLLMKTAPVGIGCLIAGKLGDAGGFIEFLPQLQQIGLYALTVVVALLIHGAITLPLILKIFGRRSPVAYAKGMTPAILTAFSTASSSATLPISLDCVITDNDVRERTAGFVLPLGATINMDGTALYEAVAAVFIANMYGIDMSLGMLLIIFLTSTLAAIGAAGIPEAGLVTMVIVLTASGLPIEGISMILIIDWALDRCRTVVNVWGDAIGAGVVDRLEGEDPPGDPVAAPAR